MEDNLPIDEVYAPGIFTQAKQIAKDEGYNIPSSTDAVKPEVVPEVELDLETTEILVQLPFDAAAHFTKLEAMALSGGESTKLAKLWRGPLQRILSKYENSDIGIAAVATAVIALGKYAEYQIAVSAATNRRNSTGDAGTG